MLQVVGYIPIKVYVGLNLDKIKRAKATCWLSFEEVWRNKVRLF